MSATVSFAAQGGASSSQPLILRGLQWRRADGSPLWRLPLEGAFSARRIGLVGRNGVGKSVLARLLAGAATPSSGCVKGASGVRLVQPHALPPGACAADLAGLGPLFQALDRLARGQAQDADGLLTDEHPDAWVWPARWAQALADAGLPPLAPLHPAQRLSGGQQQRLRLALAFATFTPWLLLDEPTNHLDADARRAFMHALASWPGRALVISHDRALLGQMSQMAELTPQGLGLFGGDHATWAEARASEAARADAALAHAQAERRRTARTLAQQHDAQQRRAMHGARDARVANLPKPLLARRKDAASAHDGRAHARRAAAQAAAQVPVREAAARAAREDAPALALPQSRLPVGRVWLRMDNLRLPWPVGLAPLTVNLSGPCRVALSGPNGAGKSTLLRVIAGQLAPASGQCRVTARTAWLDQHHDALLPPASSVQQVMAERGSLLPQAQWRTRLALLGLNAAHLAAPSGTLSAGQRLKAALACVLWSGQPPEALLLDAPTNHLDLPAVQAFEAALAGYPGALVVASHDAAFVAALGVTETLALSRRC